MKISTIYDIITKINALFLYSGKSKMDLKIRECKITDAKAIYELNIREMGYDYPKNKTEENLKKLLKSDRDKIFVAF